MALVAAALAAGRAAAQTPSVRIELERPSVGLGDTFRVFVNIERASHLAAFQFTLAFDPAVVAYVDASVGDFLGSTGRDVDPLGPITERDHVIFGAISTSETGEQGPSGSGDLAIVTLRAIAQGTSVLDLTQLLLVDTGDQQLEVDGVDGSVVVGPPSTTTPTPTDTPPASPTPTATPTPTPRPPSPDIFLPTAFRDA